MEVTKCPNFIGLILTSFCLWSLILYYETLARSLELSWLPLGLIRSYLKSGAGPHHLWRPLGTKSYNPMNTFYSEVPQTKSQSSIILEFPLSTEALWDKKAVLKKGDSIYIRIQFSKMCISASGSCSGGFICTLSRWPRDRALMLFWSLMWTRTLLGTPRILPFNVWKKHVWCAHL